MSDLYLFRNALKDLMRPKKLFAAALLVALPTLLALLWRNSAPDFQPDIAYNTLISGLVFGFLLVILAVVFGTGVIAQEIEQKTIVYLLTRPVPRWRIALVKFLAAVAVTTLTVWLASLLIALILYGPGDVASSALGRDLLILMVGAFAYTALFLLLATVFNRPLTYGLLFAFGWESWVPAMQGNFQKLSLMTYLRILAPHDGPKTGDKDLMELLSALNPQTITTSMAWTVLPGVTAVALIAACLIFSTREYTPRDDAG